MNSHQILITVAVMLLAMGILSSAHSQSADLLFEQGMAAYFKSDFKKARKKFEQAVKNDPSSVKYNYFLGNVYRKLGMSKKAISQYQQVLQLDSDHNSALQQLADMHYQQQNWNKSANLYRKLLNKQSKNYQFQFRRGVSLYKLGELSEAKTHLLRARNLNPGSAAAHFYLGRILMRNGEFLNAISRFTDAINLDSSKGKYYYYRGLARFRTEDYRSDQASGWTSAEDFHRAIDKGFENPRIHFLLGNSLLNRGIYLKKQGDEKQARKLLRRSIKSYREVLSNKVNASNAFHNLGVAYMVLGEMNLARKSVEKAILTEPTIPFMHHTLGEIYYRREKFKKAIESWTLARDLDPEYKKHPFEPMLFNKSLEKRIEEAQKELE